MAGKIDEWLSLREQLEKWGEDWDAGIVQIRLSDGRLMELDDAVPDTRGDCPTVKPCPHVRCRYHLWRVDGGEDGTRAGRPGLSAVPRDKRGLTLPVLGELKGERPGTTLEPRWLESPVPPSCALDESTRARSNEEVGECIGKHRTLAARVVPPGFENAKRQAWKMFKMTEEDLLEGFRQLRELGGMM